MPVLEMMPLIIGSLRVKKYPQTQERPLKVRPTNQRQFLFDKLSKKFPRGRFPIIKDRTLYYCTLDRASEALWSNSSV